MTSMAIRTNPSAVVDRPDADAMIRHPQGAWEWRQTTALLHDFAEWIRAAAGIDLRSEQDGFLHELADLSSVYRGDGSEMFVAFDDGLAVGTVAVRYHHDRTAELKRMYVRSAARGRGIADLLAERAVAAAGERGCRSIWLETLQGVMDPAISVYRRQGFAPSRRGGTLSVGGIVVMERRLDAREDEWP
jgi:GNAT superfamily N-acetyltransferase